MDSMTAGIVASVAAYLLGSIPFGFVTAKLVASTDIRSLGSGNIGATNVARAMGAKWGIAVLVLDCLKGSVSVWLFPQLVLDAADSAAATLQHVQVGCGVSAILGHMFPCWLRFRGGKGVATALGVVVVLAPWATLAAFIGFATVFAVFRIVALSSMIAAVVFAVAQTVMLWPQPFAPTSWSIAAFSLAIPVLIIFRHRSNLSRLLRGEEPKFQLASGKRQAGTVDETTKSIDRQTADRE